MAQHESAKKQAKQNIKRNLRNRSYLSQVRTTVKKFQVAVTALKEGKTSLAEVQKCLTAAQSYLQRAAAKHVVHRNNASRHISRLARLLARTQKAA